MRHRILCYAFALIAPIPCLAQQHVAYPGIKWDTLDASARTRWSADSLRSIGEFVNQLGSGAVIVIDDGQLVAAWGEVHRKFPLASARKSLLNALLGVEFGKGHLNLEATLAELGVDDVPALTAVEKQARVIDLLASRSGIYHEAAYEPLSMKRNRPVRGSSAPGATWFYNNWDFNALGTIYESVSGKKIFDAFESEVARPIGMEDYTPADGKYVLESGSIHPAYTFRMSASDLARLVLLYMRGGMWRDRQIVPREWVELTTKPLSNAGDGGAYAMLWWAARDGKLVDGAQVDSGSFAARGSGPHYAIAIPSRKLIIVHLANTETPNPSNWVQSKSVGALVMRILAARTN